MADNPNRRRRSLRNKIVSVITGASSVLAAAEQVFPQAVPPGSGAFAAQLGVFAALLANNLVQK